MNQNENQAKTIEAKHIFIDIVEYTHNRCVEAQSDLITTLNKIVKETTKEFKIKENDIIYSSTGDGMCITLVNVINPYDIHIKIALLILEKTSEYNVKEECKMRKFDLRIGINENTDNLITDINGHKGVSGSGINHAARIESLCDANQILIGNSVYDKLVQREKYMCSFKEHETQVKHGLKLKVFQYKNEELNYLNNKIPHKFQIEEVKLKKKGIVISELQALYMMHCIKNENFSIEETTKSHNNNRYSLIVAFFHLSQDLLKKKKHDNKKGILFQKIDYSFNEYYNNLKLSRSIAWVIMDYAKDIKKYELRNISIFFDDEYIFVNKKGKEALINNYPDLCKEYNIEI